MLPGVVKIQNTAAGRRRSWINRRRSGWRSKIEALGNLGLPTIVTIKLLGRHYYTKFTHTITSITFIQSTKSLTVHLQSQIHTKTRRKHRASTQAKQDGDPNKLLFTFVPAQSHCAARLNFDGSYASLSLSLDRLVSVNKRSTAKFDF